MQSSAASLVSLTQLSSELTRLRRQPEYGWLGALPLEPFNQVLRELVHGPAIAREETSRHRSARRFASASPRRIIVAALERAYTNFFGDRARFAGFKRKRFAGAVRFTLDQRRTQVARKSGRVRLDGLGRVKFKVTEELEGRLRSASVNRDGAGRFFISFIADRVPAKPAPAQSVAAVGIDQGVRELLVTSANDRTPVSRALAVRQARLRRYQRGRVARGWTLSGFALLDCRARHRLSNPRLRLDAGVTLQRQ